MLPDDVIVLVCAITCLGYITSHLSLYLAYKWGQIDVRLTFKNLRKSSVILILFLIYVLLHSITLTLMVVGIQYPDMLGDIVVSSLFWYAILVLPLAICGSPLIMDIKPNEPK